MGKLWTWSLLMWPMLLLLFMTQRLLSPTFVESRVSGDSGSSAGAVASLTWVHALFPYTYRFGGAVVAKAVDIMGVRRAGLARARVCVDREKCFVAVGPLRACTERAVKG
jgi:hypothetical protein